MNKAGLQRSLGRLIGVAIAVAVAGCKPAPVAKDPVDQWWADVSTLADDKMEGRQTGSAGYDRAAAYVVDRLEKIGLEPAGEEGFLQPIDFEEQTIDFSRSSASLVREDGVAPLRLPGDMTIGRGGGRRPAKVEAPLIFLGYGLHLPKAGHDDFAGADLRGKIAVVITGGPQDISGSLKAHARRDRSRLLAERGAAGVIALTAPKAIESPWSRTMAQASLPGMYFADAALRDIRTPFFDAGFNGDSAERLFERSGRTFAEIGALADASKPLPRLDLKQSLRAAVTATYRPVRSPNIVARLPGSDPSLKGDHLVFTAHLDHLGIGKPVNGDGLHNGALDNAAGVASLLDIARDIRARGAPKRSILFVFVTAEEKGLLGSRYFSLRPTVPKSSLVANFNFDMALPIFPLRSVTALGAEESSLGDVARTVSEAMGLPLVPDAFPDRNAFTRSDQYSFVREGIPALAFKFGFAKDTPEAAQEKEWRSARYHAPSDDLGQPIAKADAVRLNKFVAELGWRVANDPARPAWRSDSFFRRFAKR